jgi:hypothetical protein
MGQVYTLVAAPGAIGIASTAPALTYKNHIFAGTASFGIASVGASKKLGVIMNEGMKVASIVRMAQGVSLSVGVGFTLTQVQLVKLGGLISETVGFLHGQDQQTRYGVTVLDLPSFSSLATLAKYVAITDGLGMHAAVSTAIGGVILDALGLGATTAPGMKYGATFAESFLLSDAVRKFIGLSVSDALGVHDGPSPAWRPTASLADGLGIGSALTPKLLFKLQLHDDINVTDAQLLKMTFSGVVTDGIKIRVAYVAPGGEFTTWAVNLVNNAVTQYNNYTFNSFARLGNHYLGASEKGLYILDGQRDETSNIVSRIRSGYAQFNAGRLAGLKGVYLAMRGSGEFLFKVITDDGAERIYKVVTNDSMKTTRVNIGKGIRARFFAFELQSTGPDFDLESVEFIPMLPQRRV